MPSISPTTVSPTTVSPTATNANAVASAATAPTTNSNNANQFGKDTFLKLLVAQLKYQNPMSPADGTQFLAQTAQFTMVEKLDEISKLVKNNAAANEVLEAGSMIGKNVTVATKNGASSVTTVDHIGGNLSNDAPVGTKVPVDTTLYTNKGTKVPMTLEFTKLADGADGSHHWAARSMLNKTQIGGVQTVDFDKYGERTSPDIKLTAANLDTIPGSKGLWDQAGIRIDLGAPGDGQRLRATAGGSTLSDIGQNGTDGTSIKGVVTGTRFTIDGPLLSIGGKEYSLSDVTEVHATS